MNKTIVRCRCGHQVLSKEVLRTDLYERRAPGFDDNGRDYVYVKYRCRRCKRMGEAFVAESHWDWAMLEAEPNEMTEQERDRFLDEEPVSSEEILDFHRQLETFSLRDLASMNDAPETETETVADEITDEVSLPEPRLSKPEIAKPDAAKMDAKAKNINARPPDDSLGKRA